MEKYFDMYICVLGSESQEQSREKDIWYSIFPIENQDLLYKRWEDDIIWDAEVRLSGEITTVVSGIIMSNDFIYVFTDEKVDEWIAVVVFLSEYGENT